jgi:hypothetical protein
MRNGGFTMKRISKIIALCAAFFVAGTFTLPAQFAPMDTHAATNVKINKTKATVSKGDTLQLRVTGTKKKAKRKKVLFRSSHHRLLRQTESF